MSNDMQAPSSAGLKVETKGLINVRAVTFTIATHEFLSSYVRSNFVKGARTSNILQHVDYIPWLEVSSGLPGFTNVVCFIQLLSLSYIVRGDEQLALASQSMVRPTPKGTFLMTRLVQNLLKPRQLPLESFASTLSTGKDFQFVEKHHHICWM